MSIHKLTTESEEKQPFRPPRPKFPHVAAFLQTRIAENETRLLQSVQLQAALREDCAVSFLVLEYHVDRLRVEIQRDQQHLFEITVS